MIWSIIFDYPHFGAECIAIYSAWPGPIGAECIAVYWAWLGPPIIELELTWSKPIKFPQKTQALAKPAHVQKCLGPSPTHDPSTFEPRAWEQSTANVGEQNHTQERERYITNSKLNYSP